MLQIRARCLSQSALPRSKDSGRPAGGRGVYTANAPAHECSIRLSERSGAFPSAGRGGARRGPIVHSLAFNAPFTTSRASLVAQTVKRLPAMQETRVRFLGQEDPLEKEMAIHSSTLAWKIPWTEEPDRLQSMGSQRV